LTTQAQAAAIAVPAPLDLAAPPTLNCVLHIRVTQAERDAIRRAAADHADADISAYIRAAIDAYGRT
jgi:predicted RNase H-like nuclease